MDIKTRRRPPNRRMTTRAVRRQVQRRVARVCALVVIRRVARRTTRGRARIPAGVALQTGRGLVRTGQWEMRAAVVKHIRPAARRMAYQAGRTIVRITVYTRVLVVRFRVGMTGDARKDGIIARVRVAVRASAPGPLVFATVNGKIIRVVLAVFCRHPVRIGRMAIHTVLRKLRQPVIRVDGVIVVRLMACVAVLRRIGIRSSDVALRTIQQVVPLGQRKKIVGHFIRVPIKPCAVVAIRAGRRKARLLVVGVHRTCVVLPVTIQTIIPDPVKPKTRFRFVATRTIRCPMRTHQRKTVVLMQFRYPVHQPMLRRMATRTVRPNRPLVQIHMAGDTG